MQSHFSYRLPGLLSGALLVLPLVSSALAGEIRVTARGIVTDDQYTQGPYVAGQVGDLVEFEFKVFTPGLEVVPGYRMDYTVDSSSFRLTIGTPHAGTPIWPSIFTVVDSSATPGDDHDWMQLSCMLTNDEFAFFEMIGPTNMFASLDLTQEIGLLPVSQFGDIFAMQITGSGGFMRIELTEVAIGYQPEFAPFCSALPNSTGLACELQGAWLPTAGSGAHLSAIQGPPGEFGYFLVGNATLAPGGLIGQGRLCLATGGFNTIGRYNVVGTPWYFRGSV